MNATERSFNLSGAHRRFRRGQRDGIILGVCAGLADFFTVDRTVVRLVGLLLLWFFTVPTLLVYFLLAWLGDTR